MFGAQYILQHARVDVVHSSSLPRHQGHHPAIMEAAGKGKGDKIIYYTHTRSDVYLIACYRESARDVAQAIDEHLRQKGHKIDQDAFAHLTAISRERIIC
jgi:hypothetical protein